MPVYSPADAGPTQAEQAWNPLARGRRPKGWSVAFTLALLSLLVVIVLYAVAIR